MQRRFVIHAGFHKTGTTTLQKLLRLNRAALAPYARILLRNDMTGVCTAARGYSETRSPLDLGLLQFELAEILQDLTRAPADIILSSEDLAGHMPGRKGLKTYDAAPQLMAAIAQTIHALDPDADVTFFFTTRASAAWLRSCYAQHLKAVRMVLGEAEYVKDYAASAQLEHIVNAVTAAVPGCHVDSISLETASPDRLGPLDTLLSLTRIPQAQQNLISPIPFENTAPPPDVMGQLLALNRSDLDNTALNKRKKAVRSRVRTP